MLRRSMEASTRRDEGLIERLAAFLASRGVLDELALHRALRAQRQSGERFDLVLTRLGLIAEADLARLLAEFLGLPLLDPSQLPEVPLLADRLQLQFLKSNRIIPVADRGDSLLVAIADPFNTEAAAAVSYLLDRPVECGVMPAGDIERALERLYGRGGTVRGRGRLRGGRPGQRGRRAPPGGHGERGAGDPAGARPHHAGGGGAGLRHPRRAARGQPAGCAIASTAC